MQLNAYAAVFSELEEDEIGEKFAEAVQLAYTATNTLSQAKGKSKGKDKGKKGGNSNLTMADRKAKLAEPKVKEQVSSVRCRRTLGRGRRLVRDKPQSKANWTSGTDLSGA